jgi:hypothetical protein
MAVACRTRGEASHRGNNERLDTRGTGGGVGPGAGGGGGLAAGVEGRFVSRFLDLDMRNGIYASFEDEDENEGRKPAEQFSRRAEEDKGGGLMKPAAPKTGRFNLMPSTPQ